MHNNRFREAFQQRISDMYSQANSPFYLRGDECGRNGTRFADLGELEQATSNVFHHQDLSRSTTTTTGSSYNNIKASNVSVVSNNIQFGGLNNSLGSGEMGSSVIGGAVEAGQLMVHGAARVGVASGGALGNGQFEKWRDSVVVADQSQTTNSSTYTVDKNQVPFSFFISQLLSLAAKALEK